MSVSFGRVVSVTAMNVSREMGKRAVTLDTLEISQLRISFHIEKTIEQNPNNAIIEIYNMSPASIAFFEKKDGAIILRGGYSKDPLDTSNLKQIFSGDIAKVTTQRKGADIVTKIEAGDGENAFINSSAELSFAPGTNTGNVLDKLTSMFGLGMGEIKGVDRNKPYVNGLAVSGMIRRHIDALAKRHNVEWSIQDGKIQILPFDKATDEETVVLTPETGLVGSPFRQVVVRPDLIKSSGKESESKTENGNKFKSLLNPDLKPGRAVKVQSKYVTGLFRIHKVDHSGDTHAQDFYSEVEGRSL
jgi:hypothetical protein